MWVEYKLSCEETGFRAAAYTTFCTLWRTLIPQIMVMKPMTDLCWVCQQNSATIMRSANIPEEEKSEVKLFFSTQSIILFFFFHCKVLKQAELHLDLAMKARSYLKAQVTAAKLTILKLYTEKDLPLPTVGACLLPASNNITMHFSFNRFVNSDSYVPSYETITILQVHYPSNPQQPGPMYFLTPRKCGIFVRQYHDR